MNRTVLAVASALALLGSSTASAWQPIASGSPTWVPPVPYSLNSAGSADLGGFGPTEAEVIRAMDDWTRVSCTSLSTNYRGSTGARPGSYEGTSTIGWTESGWPHSSSAIGVTGPRWGRNIIEADMEMNGVNFTWTTGSGSFSNVNAYSIILHEGGHFYGLGHTNVRGSSMWPSYGGGIIGLGPDDEAGICALYPGSGTDCTTTGCPSGQECVDGSCQAVVGDGTICAPCTTSSQCGGASDYCLGYPDGAGYCGRSCSSDAQCDGGRCVNTSAGPQCVRFDGSSPSCAGTTPPTGCTLDSDCGADQLCDGGTCVPRPTTGAMLGAPCGGDSECQSGLCLAGVCTQSCDWTNPTGSCPSGFYCDADSSTSCDVGYCLAGAPGDDGIGESCASDTECASLHCDGGVCSQPCIPDGALACPAGYACQVGTLPCRGSCRLSGAIGDECELNDDCTSGICASQGDRSFCTDLCTDTTPCPDRFTCTPVGDVSVCVPDAGGLGEACAGNEDCLSGICASEGDDSYCTRLCTDFTPCPGTSYECVATSDPSASVCRPVEGGCGCRAAGTGPGGAPLAFLLAAVGAILGWRRRR